MQSVDMSVEFQRTIGMKAIRFLTLSRRTLASIRLMRVGGAVWRQLLVPTTGESLTQIHVIER